MGRKPNYGYEKRQKEIARKARKEEKRKRKSDEGDNDDVEQASPSVESPGSVLSS